MRRHARPGVPAIAAIKDRGNIVCCPSAPSDLQERADHVPNLAIEEAGAFELHLDLGSDALEPNIQNGSYHAWSFAASSCHGAEVHRPHHTVGGFAYRIEVHLAPVVVHVSLQQELDRPIVLIPQPIAVALACGGRRGIESGCNLAHFQNRYVFRKPRADGMLDAFDRQVARCLETRDLPGRVNPGVGSPAPCKIDR